MWQLDKSSNEDRNEDEWTKESTTTKVMKLVNLFVSNVHYNHQAQFTHRCFFLFLSLLLFIFL